MTNLEKLNFSTSSINWRTSSCHLVVSSCLFLCWTDTWVSFLSSAERYLLWLSSSKQTSCGFVFSPVTHCPRSPRVPACPLPQKSLHRWPSCSFLSQHECRKYLWGLTHTLLSCLPAAGCSYSSLIPPLFRSVAQNNLRLWAPAASIYLMPERDAKLPYSSQQTVRLFYIWETSQFLRQYTHLFPFPYKKSPAHLKQIHLIIHGNKSILVEWPSGSFFPRLRRTAMTKATFGVWGRRSGLPNYSHVKPFMSI